MAEKGDRRDAERQVQLFRRTIETYLKRFHPSTYLPFAATVLRAVMKGHAEMAVYPPHFLLHSIEANCAHHRSHFRDVLTGRSFDRLMNAYKDYSDPAIHHVLTARNGTDMVYYDAEQFLMVTARHQFPPQRHQGPHDLARAIYLFQRHPFPDTEACFRDKLGFSFREWMDFCLSLTAIAYQSSPVITPDSVSAMMPGELPTEMVRPALRLLSRTSEELGREFLKLREDRTPLVDWQVPSLLPERPLVDIGDQHFVITHLPYLECRGTEGLYDICRQLFDVPFGAEFGASFARYVGLLLHELPSPKQIWPESTLSKFVSGQVCDYLLAYDDCILLVECKAVENSLMFLTEASIRRNNATEKISEGLCQVANVANALHAGELEGLVGPVGSRKVLAAIVTYRDIFLANGRLYWSAFKDKLAAEPDAVSGIDTLAWAPQVMDIRTLEKLVRTVRTGRKLTALFDGKLSKRLYEAGEWEAFLDPLLTNAPGFPFLDAVFDSYGEEGHR